MRKFHQPETTAGLDKIMLQLRNWIIAILATGGLVACSSKPVVPYATAEAFAKAMKKAGRKCRLVGFDGQKHGFFNREPSRAKTLGESDLVLAELGWFEE